GAMVYAPDLPGHGSSDPAEDGQTLVETAADLAARYGTALWVGYSMGGRLALRLAVDVPEAVAGLVLVGATAGIDGASERLDRRSADDSLASRIEEQGVDRFLSTWMSLPLFGDFRAEADDLA